MARIDGNPGSVSPFDLPDHSTNQSLETVQFGENKLSDVAQRLGVDVQSLIQANPHLGEGAVLKAGQDIRLPQNGSMLLPADGKVNSDPKAMPYQMLPADAKLNHETKPMPFQVTTVSSDPLEKTMAQMRLGGTHGGVNPSLQLGNSASSAPATTKYASSLRDPLPSPKDVPDYSGIPTSKGELAHANSGVVEGWLERMEEHAGAFPKAQQKLDRAMDDYTATRYKDNRAIETAMQRDVPKGVAALDKQSGGKVGQLTRDYQEERKLSDQAVTERDAAVDVADSALTKYGIAGSTIDLHAAELEKQHLEGDKKEINEKIAANDELAGKIVDYASELPDPAGLAKHAASDMLKSTISEGLSSDAKLDLFKVQAKLDAVDEKIQGMKDGKDKNELLAAKQTLQGAMKKVVVADKQHQLHSNKADAKLDQLVKLEKDYGKTTVFRAVRQYNVDMTKKGENLDRALGEFNKVISNPDLTKARSAITARIDEDKKWAQRSGGSRDAIDDFMGKANQIEHYAERVDDWQKAQHAAVGKARNALSGGADLVTVDKAMDNIVTKSLEGQDLSSDKGYMQRR
jgi:LysM repeat protein